MKLVFQPAASQDLEEAGIFYESREMGLGERFLDDVDRLLFQIRDNPLRFPIVENGIRRGLARSFPFALYFLADQDTIVVLAILHQHRDASTWRRRL